MDIKEKLMELLDIMFNGEYCIDKTEAADFLIANGVTVQEHGWIKIYAGSMYPYSCSKCGNCHARIVKFCERCGTKLDLPQPSKGK